MPKDASIASWTSRWRLRRRAPTDWADLGTAYGLEMSLRARPGHDDRASPDGASAAQPPRLRWWQRMAARATAALR